MNHNLNIGGHACRHGQNGHCHQCLNGLPSSLTRLHHWVEEDLDCGPLGSELFWKCTGCGACGGPVYRGVYFAATPPSEKLTPEPFMPSCWPVHPDPLDLDANCEIAALQIKEATTVTLAKIDVLRQEIADILAKDGRTPHSEMLSRRVTELLCLFHGWPDPIGRLPIRRRGSE